MCAMGAGKQAAADRRDERVDREPSERALVDEPQLRPVVGEPHPDAQVLLVGSAGVGDEHLTAHAEVGEHGVVACGPAVELQPEVLAAAARLGDRPTGQAGGEVGVAREMAAHRARMGDRDVGDRALAHVLGEAAPDDLDLRQLGHARPPTNRRRSRWWPLS